MKAFTLRLNRLANLATRILQLLRPFAGATSQDPAAQRKEGAQDVIPCRGLLFNRGNDLDINQI
jgi:hypothetical protein